MRITKSLPVISILIAAISVFGRASVNLLEIGAGHYHEPAALLEANQDPAQTEFAGQNPAGSQSGTFQYVASWGNDRNSGLNWGAAKATWDGACEALSGGHITRLIHYCGIGTIYTSSNIWACPNQGYGLQLMGNQGDPNYPYSGTCWEMLQGSIHTVCVGGNTSTSNGSTVCNIQGGSAADTWHPGLWITASGTSLEFDGYQTQYQGTNVILGLCSNHADSPMHAGECGVSGLLFNGVETTLGSANSTNGPGWLLGTNDLWITVNNFSISGNPNATQTNPNAAAVQVGEKSSSYLGAGAITFSHGIVIGGGFQIYSGTEGSQTLSITDLTSENNLEAMVWLRGPYWGQYHFEDIKSPYDCAGDCYGIRNDTGVPVPAINVYGQISGPVELITPKPLGNPTATASTTNLFGFISPTKFRSQSDAAAREFPAVMAIGTPLLSSTVTLGTIRLCGTCSLTTGELDPSGGTNAVQVSDSNPGGDNVILPAANPGAVVGDTFVYSLWVKPVTGNCCASNDGLMTFRLQGSNGNTCAPSERNFTAPLQSYSNAPSWEHYVGTCKIATYTDPTGPTLEMGVSSVSTMQYFNPQVFLLHGYSDDEVSEVAVNLGTWSSSCSAGQLCNIHGPISGGLFSTKTSAYTLTVSDSWINVTGKTTIKAPHAIVGQIWTVFNSGANIVTLEADNGKINGTSSVSINPNKGTAVTCDGKNCFAH